MTSMALVIAAGLTFVIGAAHSWLGERRLIGPLLAPGNRQGMLAKSAFSRGVLRFAWHITTLAWWGMALILAALAQGPIDGSSRRVLAILAGTFALTGAVTLISSRGRHLAWPVFMAIAALTVWPVLP